MHDVVRIFSTIWLFGRYRAVARFTAVLAQHILKRLESMVILMDVTDKDVANLFRHIAPKYL